MLSAALLFALITIADFCARVWIADTQLGSTFFESVIPGHKWRGATGSRLQ